MWKSSGNPAAVGDPTSGRTHRCCAQILLKNSNFRGLDHNSEDRGSLMQNSLGARQLTGFAVSGASQMPYRKDYPLK